MKYHIDNLKLPLRKLFILFACILSLCIAACNNTEKQGNDASNVGQPQDEMEIDTTASSGRGGTQESTGRADADTSGTGKAAADSVQ